MNKPSEHAGDLPGSTRVFTPCPVMTFEKFSDLTGLRVGQIRAQVSRGNLPGIKIGRLLLVNTVKLLQDNADVSTIPLMTFERFAEASGLREQQVESQAQNNNLDTRYVGRLRLVDVAELTRKCLENE